MTGTDDDQPPTDFGAAMDDYRARSGIARFGRSARSRRTYIARALLDVAAHAEEKGLRDYQGEAVGEVAKRVGDAARPPLALVVIPTGGGKTISFQTVVSACETTNADGVRYMPNVVVLVPTKVLIRQTMLEFRKRFDLPVSYLSSEKLLDDDGKPLPYGVGPVTLMTYAGFTQAADPQKALLKPRDVDLLVMDEAHRGLSDLRKSTLEPFLRECVVTAWTATPAFDQEKNVQNLLGRGSEVYRISAEELRRRKVIAPVVNYVLAVGLDGREPEDKVATLALRRRALVDAVLDFMEEQVDHGRGVSLLGKTAVFYGANLAHARLFADAYNERFGGSGERLMELVTGNDSPERLRDVFARVAAGEITALSNSKLLMEGFDMAKIGLVINSPSEKPLKIVQQSGRAQRLDPAIDAGSPEQTSFVIDTYYKINGRTLGKPCFTYQAFGDDTIAADPVEIGYRMRRDAAGTVRAERRRDANRRTRASDGFDALPPALETVAHMTGEAVWDAPAEADAPPKDADWLSFFDLTEETRPDRAGRARLWDAFSSAEAAFRVEGIASVEDEVFDGGMRSENGRVFFCLDRDSARRLAVACGVPFLTVRPAADDDLSFEALAAALGVPSGHPGLRAMWTSLDAALRSRTVFELPDGPLDAAMVGFAGRVQMSVSRKDLDRIREFVVPPPDEPDEPVEPDAEPWTADYLDAEAVVAAIGLGGRRAWRLLMRSVEDGSDRGLRVLYMTKDGESGYFLHRDDVATLRPDRKPAARSGSKRAGGWAKHATGLLTWPVPERLPYAQACLLLGSLKDGTADLAEAWRRCTQAWRRGEPARPFGIEVRGHVDGGESMVERDSVVAFGKVAGVVEWIGKLSRDILVDAHPTFTERQFLLAVGATPARATAAAEAFAELERTWQEDGLARLGDVFFSGAGRAKGRRHFTIRHDDVHRLAALLGYATDVTPDTDRARMSDVRRMLGLVGDDPHFDALWASLAHFRSGNEPPILADGLPLECDRDCFGPHRTYFSTVAVADIPRIAAHLDAERRRVPEWTPDYVQDGFVGQLIEGASYRDAGEALAALRSAAEDGDLGEIRAGWMRNRGSLRFYLHIDDIALFEDRFLAEVEGRRLLQPGAQTASAVPWQAGYLNDREVRNAIRPQQRPKARLAWEALVAEAAEGVEHGLRFRWMKKGRQRDHFLHMDDVNAFCSRYMGMAGIAPGTEIATLRLSWPLPQHMSYQQLCLALGSRKNGSEFLAETWDECARAWSKGEVATIGGRRIRGRPAAETGSFLIEKASAADFGWAATAASLRKRMAKDSELPAQDRIAAIGFWLAVGGRPPERPAVEKAFAELERAWRAHGTASFRGIEFPSARIEPGQRSFTIAKDDVGRLAEALGLPTGIKPIPGRARLIDVYRLLGLTEEEPALEELWQRFRPNRDYRKKGAREMLEDGPIESLPFSYRAFRSAEQTVDVEDVPRIARHIESVRGRIPEWTADYIHVKRAARQIDAVADVQATDYGLDALVKAAKAGPVDGIRAGYMRRPDGIHFFVHADDLDAVRARFVDPILTSTWSASGKARVSLPKKEPGMLDLREILEKTAAEGEDREAIEAAFAAVESGWIAGGRAAIGGLALEGGVRSIGYKAAFCLTEKSARLFAAACGYPFPTTRPARHGDLFFEGLAAALDVATFDGGAYRKMWNRITRAARNGEPLLLASGPVEVAMVESDEEGLTAAVGAEHVAAIAEEMRAIEAAGPRPAHAL